MPRSKEELRNELIELFDFNVPDESYLADNPETKEEVEAIQKATASGSAVDLDKQIRMLIDFNNEWFPDGLEEDEQAVHQALLDEAAAAV